MASYHMHICIAKKINEKLKIDENLFFIGSIAPDLPTELGKPNNKSHFLDDETGVIMSDIFYKKYKNDLYNPYVMGYFVHLLTDYLWFSKYISKYINEYLKKENLELSLRYKDLKKKILNDYSNLSDFLEEKYSLNLEKLNCENVLETKSIEEIDATKLNVLIDRLSKNKYLTDDKTLYVMNEEYMEDFIENCAVEILKILEDLNLTNIL